MGLDRTTRGALAGLVPEARSNRLLVFLGDSLCTGSYFLLILLPELHDQVLLLLDFLVVVFQQQLCFVQVKGHAFIFLSEAVDLPICLL